MSNEIQEHALTSTFIEEWMRSYHIGCERDVSIPRSGKTVDYLISESKVGIMIVLWNKPISVKIVNHAIYAIENLNLDTIYLICKKVSDYAQSTIDKLGYDIKIVHPLGLSDIAVMLANHGKQYSKLMT
ncbi:MAG: hypothetical protein INQ03_12045 [Candidatus Heimdallarchaeota archaeon]|nr:hypothetical protein [Candidatus Heimdallarchaeota archaeon]